MEQFLQNALTCAVQVGVMALLILVGFLLYRGKKLTDDGIKQMTYLLLWIITPCLIINSLQNAGLTLDSVKQLGMTALSATVSYALCIGIALLILCRAPKQDAGILRYAMIFSNAGFMGIPLAEAVFGSKATPIAAIYVVFFNLLTWTLGVRFYGQKLNLKKALINPGTIGLTLGVLLVLLPKLWGGDMPVLVTKPISLIAGLNLPLSMMVVGTYLVSFRLKFERRDLWLGLICLMRLLIIPLLTLGVLTLLGFDPWIVAIATVPVCAPSAANTTLFAVQFGKDPIFSSRIVAVTTLLSILTMPLIVALSMIRL